ncbi:MAG: hypothetical protein Q8R82_13035 [Hyphomonadaceae bacterium]|nr:hypothetical protein [Hyphomonadaceae bacterium]
MLTLALPAADHAKPALERQSLNDRECAPTGRCIGSSFLNPATGRKFRWEKSAGLEAQMFDFLRTAHARRLPKSLIHSAEIGVHDS